MTPRDIITGLRAAGVCPLLPRESGRILRTGGRRDLLESAHALNLMLEMHRQHAGCIAFLRSELQPWQPARCVIGDEDVFGLELSRYTRIEMPLLPL